MSLTSEEVHWVAGAPVTLLALVLILSECRVIAVRWVRYLIPAALLAWGTESMLDPLIHGAALPMGYSAEMFQHYLIGVLLCLPGPSSCCARGALRRRVHGCLPCPRDWSHWA